ncbi:hypothetical protein SARC_04044 [Sphaeroforma arctica JP610]|uniref:CCHC-type domain-containing protein n=1 Tax=Sphaeroforma arctica JP610 TaxID=667725 RepID=A0A0L0G4B2_9EUKA|nr:hypothetical protein SARC_04044 [Sphaeroforma arctica JP610]KNC83714.1 hypothetical protein SARC_04044 [Sphaeroforma arctica JP610]|eukprot:XP_014157616.1 hypothetical protein SARC_04044 [Sphaeroforma arctica JP610]
MDEEKHPIDDVYQMTMEFEGDHQLHRSDNAASGIIAINTNANTKSDQPSKLYTNNGDPGKDNTAGQRERRNIICPLCNEKGRGIHGCPSSICRKCGSNNHKGNKCPVDRSTLHCSKCNKAGQTDAAFLQK